MNNKTTRCTVCASEFSDDELEGATKCPKCGDTGVPMDIANDVVIKINWHELRILSIWAENWAKQIKGEIPNAVLTIMSIAERLQRQYPNKAPLTLFSEVRDLRKEYDIESHIDSDDHLGL